MMVSTTIVMMREPPSALSAAGSVTAVGRPPATSRAKLGPERIAGRAVVLTQRTEVVRWKSPEGPEIEGLLTVTPHVEAGQSAPLVVMPHGGPDGMSNENFSIWPLYFAARGYSVLRPNYRGGFAYGREFYAANRGRLGEIEFLDIEFTIRLFPENRKCLVLRRPVAVT